MRLLNFVLALFLVTGLFSCEENKNSTQEESQPLTLDMRSEYTEIGVIVDGVFEFTVSEDQLQENFNTNAESNLGVSGEMTEAYVTLPDDENGLESPLFIVRGSLGPDDSAQMTDIGTVFEGGDGVSYLRIRHISELGWICTGCKVCKDNSQSQGTGYCKCIYGSGSTLACVKEIPRYTWTFKDPSPL